MMYATGGNGPPGDDFNDDVMAEMVDAEILFVTTNETQQIKRLRRRRSLLQHRRRRYMMATEGFVLRCRASGHQTRAPVRMLFEVKETNGLII